MVKSLKDDDLVIMMLMLFIFCYGCDFPGSVLASFCFTEFGIADVPERNQL